MAPTTDMRLCIDRVVPDRYQPARATAQRAARDLVRTGSALLDGSSVIPPERMALLTLKKWQNGTKLRCRFLDGDDRQRSKVAEMASLWEDHANIDFDFGDDPDAEIRISFQADAGSWSAIGTDCLVEAYFPRYEPTVNFGWLRDDTDDTEYERVVVHEFGHVLGCIHEHQSPGVSLRWKKDEVYRVFSGPPNYWTREQIDHNILDHYSRTQTQFSTFDDHSIMLYAFPGTLFENGVGTPVNTELSKGDRDFIAQMYPRA